MSSAAIIFSNLNTNTLSRLTADRTVAAIPFACRYRLIDFALSNMVNANISNINVVVNYNYRSLLDHIGSGKDWDLARRAGGINCISPYQMASSGSAKVYSTHMEALRNMTAYIDDMKEDYVVLSDCHCIANIDLKAAIADHAANGATITFVTTECAEGYTSKNPVLMFGTDGEGVVRDAVISAKHQDNAPELSTGIQIMSCDYLRRLLIEAEAHNYRSLTYDVIMKNASNGCYRTFKHNGYFAHISSFTDYFKNSLDLTTNRGAFYSLLGIPERRIFTRVHNSAPVSYLSGSSVANSLIADDCVIEGRVENSILFRGVKIGRGTVVKNSILFGGTTVGRDCELNCVVTDKSVTISDFCRLSGHESLPFYIGKMRRV